jgi:hypothetical protein
MNPNTIIFNSMTIALALVLLGLGPIIASLYNSGDNSRLGIIPKGPCQGGPFTVIKGHAYCTHLGRYY